MSVLIKLTSYYINTLLKLLIVVGCFLIVQRAYGDTVPLKQENTDSCGPACIRMVVETVTNNRNSESFVRKVSAEFPGGYSKGSAMSAPSIVSTLDRFGIESELKSKVKDPLKSLEKDLRGGPAILFIAPQMGHFVVVDSINQTKQLVMGRDPESGMHFSAPIAMLEAIWSQKNYSYIKTSESSLNTKTPVPKKAYRPRPPSPGYDDLDEHIEWKQNTKLELLNGSVRIEINSSKRTSAIAGVIRGTFQMLGSKDSAHFVIPDLACKSRTSFLS